MCSATRLNLWLLLFPWNKIGMIHIVKIGSTIISWSFDHIETNLVKTCKMQLWRLMQSLLCGTSFGLYHFVNIFHMIGFVRLQHLLGLLKREPPPLPYGLLPLLLGVERLDVQDKDLGPVTLLGVLKLPEIPAKLSWKG